MGRARDSLDHISELLSSLSHELKIVGPMAEGYEKAEEQRSSRGSVQVPSMLYRNEGQFSYALVTSAPTGSPPPERFHRVAIFADCEADACSLASAHGLRVRGMETHQGVEKVKWLRDFIAAGKITCEVHVYPFRGVVIPRRPI